MSDPIGRLHVLTDFLLQQRFSHEALAERAIEGGADVIQFREKRGNVRPKLWAAKRVVARGKKKGATVLIDDHVDVCLGVGADGVHLGQRDFPLPDARRILGDEAIIGATATTTAQAIHAEQEGADYIGFGPVFPSSTKDNPSSVKGLDGLRVVCDAISLPVIAISGITPDRVASVVEAGAHGVAVLSYVALADDPARAAGTLRNALDEATG